MLPRCDCGCTCECGCTCDCGYTCDCGCTCDSCEMQTVLSGCTGTGATKASASCWIFVAKTHCLLRLLYSEINTIYPWISIIYLLILNKYPQIFKESYGHHHMQSSDGGKQGEPADWERGQKFCHQASSRRKLERRR